MRFLLSFLLAGIAPFLHAQPASIPLQPDAVEKAADPVMGSAAGWTVRLDLDGYFPDENIRVDVQSVDAQEQGAGAFITRPPYLDGKERQDYHRVYIRPTGEDWTEQSVTVMPDADGKLTLTCYAVAPGAMNIVHWDDLRVEGATLENGGFEAVGEDGLPVGWTRGGWRSDAPEAEYRTEAGDADEGIAYVTASWTWQWRAMLTDVQKGRPITLRWKTRFVPPETRYPVRVGLNGLHGSDPDAHMHFDVPDGMDTDNDAPERYVRRLLDGFDPAPYGGARAVNEGLAIYLAEAGPEWSECTIAFTPKRDGELEMTLHGARLRDLASGRYDPQRLDYRRLVVTGAELANPDFTDRDDDGTPEQWSRVGRDESFPMLEKAGAETILRTWYQAGLRTRLTGIKAGVPVEIRFEARTVPAGANQANSGLPPEFESAPAAPEGVTELWSWRFLVTADELPDTIGFQSMGSLIGTLVKR